MNKVGFAVLLLLQCICINGQEINITVEAPVSAVIDQNFRVEYNFNTDVAGVQNYSITTEKDIKLVVKSHRLDRTTQSINGEIVQTYTTTYIYTFRATRAGILNIPRCLIQIGDEEYSSQSQTIEVLDSKSETFLRLHVSKKEIFENEKITATLSLYTNETIVRVDEFVDLLPDGFIIKDLPLPEIRTFRLTNIKGRNYSTIDIFIKEFEPLYTGNLAIEKYLLNLAISTPSGREVATIFGPQEELVDKERQIRSERCTIKVKPLETTIPQYDIVRPFYSYLCPNRIWTKQDTSVIYVLDASGTMDIQDLKPNRLKSLQTVLLQHGPRGSRTGIVLFGQDQEVLLPLEERKDAFTDALSKIDAASVDKQGTSIGNGLIAAIDQLKDYPEDKKYIILITDGDNNSGIVNPATAALIANSFGISIYIVGISTPNGGNVAIYDNAQKKYSTQNRVTKINTSLFSEIANSANGAFFLAASNKGLAAALDKVALYMHTHGANGVKTAKDSPFLSRPKAKEMQERLIEALKK